MNGLTKRLLTEPDYRPYCLSCSTMQRMVLIEKNGRRIMKCDIVAENHHMAKMMWQKFRILPRIGCGMEFDVETGKAL